MLKSKKEHFIPEYECHKQAGIKSYGGHESYDPLHELGPIELCQERIRLVELWMKKNKKVEGALLIGSYAKGTQREDSDVDFIIIVEDPTEWIEKSKWVKEFGAVVSMNQENYEDVLALRVYFQDDVELEFGFVTKEWLTKPYKEATQEALSGGYKILVDNNGILNHL